jgi:glycine oxidase
VETAEVVIAGAGIIGLSLALDLARRGIGVTVLERGRAMAESSWAAAGMLAATDPENPPEFDEIAALSLTLYPEYLALVEQLSRKNIPLRTRTTIQAISGSHPFHLLSGRKLTHPEVQALVSGVECRLESFVLLDEASLDPRDLCAALPAAAIAAGARLIEDSPVICVDAEAAGIVVRTATSEIAAKHFVNCAGAWAESRALGRMPLGHPHVTPAKGQMTTVRLRGSETLAHVLRTPEIYLVPRGDGRITVGATVEDAGYDKSVEPYAIAGLLHSAAALWPPIAEAEILESWTGLRPASSDSLPLIGPSLDPNCWIATGHFRNGILLAPATAKVLAQLICNESPAIDLAPLAPNRTAAAIARPLDRLVPPASDNRLTAAL